MSGHSDCEVGNGILKWRLWHCIALHAHVFVDSVHLRPQASAGALGTIETRFQTFEEIGHR